MVTVAVAGWLAPPRLSFTTSEKVTFPVVPAGSETSTLEALVVIGLVGEIGSGVVVVAGGEVAVGATGTITGGDAGRVVPVCGG